MKKIIGLIILGILFFLAGVVGLIWLEFYLSRPGLNDDYVLPGLQAPVEIYIDSYGVSHIYAQNEEDLFLACGFIHARDRMWQMDFNRRLGFGRLAEVLGQRALEIDIIMRTLGLKEAVDRDRQLLSSRERKLLEKYSSGVNAWLLRSSIWREPEFFLLRYRPQPWKIEDSLIIKTLMALSLCKDAVSEAVRSKILVDKGPELASRLLEVGIESFPEEVIAADLSAYFRDFNLGASNNWVISGRRTISGRPLLANDPHLRISLPSVWYEIHLACPEWEAIGVSFPGVPLVIIGHNQHIAWGLTNSGVDVQDLSGEVLDESGQFYRRRGEWRSLRRRKELFWIRGQEDPKEIIIKWTEEGPLVTPVLFTSSQPLSLRWIIYEGDRTFEALYRVNRARNWSEFRAALKLFGAPSQNFVYADREGNIGYYLSGRIPQRAPEAGLFILPREDRRTEWLGVIPEEEKPIIFNPSSGLIVTANNRLAARDYPYYLGQDWDINFRAQRIEELLRAREKHDVYSLALIQQDVQNLLARSLVEFIQKCSFDQLEARKAQELLSHWSGQIDGGPEAALFEVFLSRLWKNLYADFLGEDFPLYYHFFRRKEILFNQLARNNPEKLALILSTSGEILMVEVIERSLAQAYHFLREKFGESGNWKWSVLHSLKLNHPLGQSRILAFFNSRRIDMDGDMFTVKATFGHELSTQWAPSYRQVIDLADWDNSVAVFSSGNSGHFLSKFYDNQTILWAAGKYHPLLFSAGQVKKNIRGKIFLHPQEEK
jgi:penicillin amidase